MSCATKQDGSIAPTIRHTRNDNETVTKTLFVALDPTLQKLLVVQRQLRSLGQLNSPGLLPLIHKHHELLCHFENIMHSVRSNKAFVTQEELGSSMSVLLQYVSLPLIVACKVPACLDWNFTSCLEEESLLNRSAMFKCVDQAARLWRFLVTCVKTNDESPASGCVGPGRQTKEIWLQALISLVSALPSGQQVTENQHDSITLLDRGEGCLQSLLEAVVDLSTVCSAEDAFQVWDGGLVFRIADTCISLLTPPPIQAFERRAGKDSKRTSRSPPLSLRLAAATTLSGLLALEPTAASRQLWQQAFPGCFAGLYRSILSSLRRAQGERDASLTVKLLQCVSALINECLLVSAVKSSDALQTNTDAASMLQRLAREANRAWNDDHQHQERSHQSSARSEELPESDAQFFEQVKLRLPAPLMALIPILTSASAVNVRREVAFLLCTLYKARHQLGSDPLELAIYEACLIMASRGESMDPEPMDACHEVLNSNGTNFEVLENKIFDTIRELVPLARRRSNGQLQAKLRLLSALLSRLSTTSVKRLRVTLSTSEVAVEVQKSLISLMEVDFSLVLSHSSAYVVQVVGGDLDAKRFYESSPPRPRHLDSETLSLVNEFIHELGRLLSPRTASVVIDSMMARLYQSYSSRVERSLSLRGPSQIQWLHEWLGAFLVTKPMLQGAFQCCKRRQRILLPELFESILYAMTSSALFEPPLHELGGVEMPREGVSEVATFAISDTSALALRGNACAVQLQLDVIETFAQLLQGDFRRFLPSCLFPLLEKSIPGSSIRDIAMCTLGRIAMSCGYASHLLLIDDNLGSVVGTMSASLRIPGGRTLSGIVDLDKDVLDVAAVAALILRMVDSMQDSELTSMLSRRNAVSGLLGVVKELMSRFDHSNTRLDGDLETMVVFIRVYHATLQHMQREHSRFERAELEPSHRPNEPWLQLLQRFKSRWDLPKGGFARHRETNESSSTGSNVLEAIDRETLIINTHFAARILSRCCYTLSSSSLFVQMKSVDALISGFSYLGWIAANIPPEAEDSNGPTTAILRQVHSTWTSIAARIEATTGSVTDSRKGAVSLFVCKAIPAPRRAESIGEQRLFLSKLLMLIANMTECAGDFMAERLRESVWPCLSRVVTMFLRRKNAATSPQLNNAIRVPTAQPYAESERSLLLSVMVLLQRVYAHRAVGLAMASVIPTTGAMVLPFLGDQDKDVSEGCEAALKCMLRIDYDSLWRPLLEISGRWLPGCPLLAESNRKERENWSVVATANHEPNFRLQEAAGRLIDFIESLPEQPLDRLS
jgi:hypothetical protein